MENYTKNAVKLLPKIDSYENKLVLYTEFDGKFIKGDKVYIMVADDTSIDYEALDSLYNSSSLSSMIGYDIINIDGNKLTFDVDYDVFIENNSTLEELTIDNCFIGRVYIRYGLINRGVINGTNMYNVDLKPSSNINLIWKQGIFYDTNKDDIITNIDFNSKLSDSDLILKSELRNDNTIKSYYTKNNNGLGISYIHLTTDIKASSYITIDSSNIYYGNFKKCHFTISNYETQGRSYIYGGNLVGCLIGKNYIIDGGYLDNSEIDDITVTWNNGTWTHNYYSGISTNDLVVDLVNSGTNPFKSIIWENGIWLGGGEFPNSSAWNNGRFKDGIFNGLYWSDGSFDNGSFESTWKQGYFYGGTIKNGSTWVDGEFNDGDFIDSFWENGTFNGGTMISNTNINGTSSGSTIAHYWKNGTFNNGEITNIQWENGIFNDGYMSGCTWVNGSFYTGDIYNSTWNYGNFYSGKMNNSTWENGSFHKGSMFNCIWLNGDLFFGTLNNVDWYDGVWHNGIANTLNFSGGTWQNGVFNFGYFYHGDWLGGAFNSGYFGEDGGSNLPTWYSGNFYFGEFAGNWISGTFYTGKELISGTIPVKDKINKKYQQYKIYGLSNFKNSSTRIPKKKKY